MLSISNKNEKRKVSDKAKEKEERKKGRKEEKKESVSVTKAERKYRH